ncbi:MAG: AAA family ATPase, partial [Candidatus Nanopelagicaceae bacterium]|nr:AAA family ATPase [Candidatus Nanopelagicaceae bacterium]
MIPLAHLLRPKKLADVIGQKHLIGPNKILTKLIETDSITNLIFFGPSGTGKSCIANVIANETKAKFGRFNATTISINDVRKFVKTEGKKILFIDEIARLSRNQSDVLLPFIEDGTVVLVGASTESPFHTLSSPLISRCQILQFEPLGERDLTELLVRGIKHYRQEGKKVALEEDAARHVIRVSCGDGRKCLTLLEMVVLLNDEKTITLEMVRDASPNKYMVFGEGMKYDLLSA